MEKREGSTCVQAGNTHFSRHCERATTEPVKGEILGKIPSWLEGTLIRNGPGIQSVGSDAYKHMFDGLSILHRFHIENGEVTYMSRPLETDVYKANMAANRIVVGGFGTVSFLDPCKTIFQRIQSQFKTMQGKGEARDNCLVNVAYFGDQLYAMTESAFLRRVDPKDIGTIGDKTDIKSYVAVNHATAHPHILPDGTALNMGNCYGRGKGPQYCVIKIPPAFGTDESALAGAEIIAEIPLSSSMSPSYYHSFGMSTDKIVFIESPLKLSIFKILTSQLRAAPFSSTMYWNPKLKTRFHIASMKDGKVNPIVYESDPFFTFHHINAYEKDGQLVVDVAAYDDGSVCMALEHAADDNVKKLTYSNARRFVLPLSIPEGTKTGQNLVTLKDTTAKATKTAEGRMRLEAEILADVSCEFPRINYNFNGKNYNYFYGVTLDGAKIFESDSITKTCIRSKEVKRWAEKGMGPCEPVFVADPHGKDEDDGVVLSALTHLDDPNRATLLLLHAKTMEEMARVNFKTAGPFTATFHGQWAGQYERIHLY